MRKLNIILFFLLIYSPIAHAFDFDVVNAMKKDDITVEDLASFMDINYYKYKLLVNDGTDIFIVFRDLKNDRNVFKHKVEVDKYGEYVIRLWFKKYDDSIGGVLTKDNKSINYSLNWNQERVFSGTITNPIYAYDHVYTIGSTYDYGKEIKEKAVLLGFYSWEEKTDKEELVSEIYILTQVRDASANKRGNSDWNMSDFSNRPNYICDL